MGKQVNLGLASIDQFAAIHNVDRKTVYNWMKNPKKKIKSVRVGAHTLIKVDKELLKNVLTEAEANEQG